MVSLLTGVIGYVFLALMNVDVLFFWALLIFFLNYIPTIGSLIATIFPALFSLIQFGYFTPFLIILIGLGILEWFIGNLIEPKIMGEFIKYKSIGHHNRISGLGSNLGNNRHAIKCTHYGGHNHHLLTV